MWLGCLVLDGTPAGVAAAQPTPLRLLLLLLGAVQLAADPSPRWCRLLLLLLDKGGCIAPAGAELTQPGGEASGGGGAVHAQATAAGIPHAPGRHPHREWMGRLLRHLLLLCQCLGVHLWQQALAAC